MRFKWSIPILLALGCLGQNPTSAPEVEAAVAPVYPKLAVLGRIEGSVIVAVDISPRGAVTSASIAGGDPMLRQASLEAARLWRFHAQSRGGAARLIFSYKLMPKNTPAAELGAVFRPPSTVEVRAINRGPVHRYARAGPPGSGTRSD